MLAMRRDDRRKWEDDECRVTSHECRSTQDGTCLQRMQVDTLEDGAAPSLVSTLVYDERDTLLVVFCYCTCHHGNRWGSIRLTGLLEELKAAAICSQRQLPLPRTSLTPGRSLIPVVSADPESRAAPRLA